MTRPKIIQKLINTKFFEDVTPLWVSPGESPIPKRYHSAVNSLVEWSGPAWIDNRESNFFPIRHYLIKSCENWAAYNWDEDVRLILERKQDAKHIDELELTYRKFAIALKKAPFRNKRRMLGLSFLAEFYPDSKIEMTNSKCLFAVDNALTWFAKSLKARDRAYARYGAIEYAALPRKLPRKEVAIALSLADQISFWHPSGISKGTKNCPHPPNLTANLPWKAIEEFATANSTLNNSIIGASSIQTLVQSLARKAARVHWYG